MPDAEAARSSTCLTCGRSVASSIVSGSGKTVLASHSLLPTGDRNRPRDLAFRGGHDVEAHVATVWKRLALRLAFLIPATILAFSLWPQSGSGWRWIGVLVPATILSFSLWPQSGSGWAASRVRVCTVLYKF